jgi:protein-S-isoprenylcysteine O-methyltransferase Ste14
VTTSSRISDHPSPDSTKLGEWLFRHRTALPLPIAAAILGLRVGQAPPSALLLSAGVAVTAAGELIRLWGVHHIGAISRTRSDRLGPLVAAGPFALVRNPLYIGNIALWAGFSVTAGLLWLAPVVVLLLACEYHAIVRWEETLLETRLGDSYRQYAARVHRWLPSWMGPARSESAGTFSWRQTLFSERGTLIELLRKLGTTAERHDDGARQAQAIPDGRNRYR